MYPFFGSQQPVVLQPPVSLVLGGENYFSASTYSFVFACSEDSLHKQLYCHPMSLEVLMARGNYHNLVGIAQVPLGEVLKNEKVSLRNKVHQRCSLKVPVSAVVSQLTCAFVHCTLTLEYQGLVLKKGFPPAETQVCRKFLDRKWDLYSGKYGGSYLMLPPTYFIKATVICRDCVMGRNC
jgi:hypothetical protein